jgi:hypothetical protein
MHTQFEEDVKQYLGIPEEFDTAALIPIGFPANGVEFGRVSRHPISEVVYKNTWDNPLM